MVLLVAALCAAWACMMAAMTAAAAPPLDLSVVPARYREVQPSCSMTRGDWCGAYYYLLPEEWKAAPRGDKDCPNNCSNIGNCHYDTGICYCPAGFGGSECSSPRKRPCWRMGPDHTDINWHNDTRWGHSRCAGYCDDNDSMCYCPPGTKYGVQLPPAGAPLGTPPVRRGRPMYWCQPSTDKNNVTVPWGQLPYEHLFGPDGWCNGENPTGTCACRVDGLVGDRCHIVTETYCTNQCSGHGECMTGFCKCHPGWYGIDCSRKRKGLLLEAGDEEAKKPWLRRAVTPVPSASPVAPAGAKRKRPFVYVYDTWPEFNSDIMQYRIERRHCVYRMWDHGNTTSWADRYTYAIESVLIELFMTTGHRTFDPEEADYFFVPTMAGCVYDVYGWNAIPMWPPNFHGSRPFGSSNMLRAAYLWLSTQFPYFNRTKGQDHIWLLPHDEGACAAPREIWPGVMLSHWGRMDFPHTCGSQYHADNYDAEYIHDWLPTSFTWGTSRAHPCFDPDKDLVIPSFKGPGHYATSIYMGGAHPGGEQQTRNIFIFFRGEIGRNRDDKECKYSRCIRQTIANLSKTHDWNSKYNVVFSDGYQGGDYGALLLRSRYCFALPGDGWSARFEDAVLHGCIPIIIMDNTQVPFESILDIDAFSIRIRQADIPDIIDIVSAIPKEREEALRSGVNKVWHRYRWTGLNMIDKDIEGILSRARDNHGGRLPEQEGIEKASTSEDGPFSTIMQWLLWRIPHTRGEPRPEEKTCTMEDPQQCDRTALLMRRHIAELNYAKVPSAVEKAKGQGHGPVPGITTLPPAQAQEGSSGGAADRGGTAPSLEGATAPAAVSSMQQGESRGGAPETGKGGPSDGLAAVRGPGGLVGGASSHRGSGAAVTSASPQQQEEADVVSEYAGTEQ